MPYGAIEHKDAAATVIANDPRPLLQSIDALQDEYGWRGWLFDYEDPPYQSGYDLVDATVAEWRAAHPNAKGVTVPAGGKFESTYTEPAKANFSSLEIEAALNKVVGDYNKTENPGKFAVRKEAQNRFAIIGIRIRDEGGNSQPVGNILDLPISLASEQRGAEETFTLIAKLLSAKAGIAVAYGGYGGMADNCASQSKVTVGGENLPARMLIQQTTEHMNCIRIWRLLYDADEKKYFLTFRNEIKNH
jgi:hypothetical protein